MNPNSIKLWHSVYDVYGKEPVTYSQAALVSGLNITNINKYVSTLVSANVAAKYDTRPVVFEILVEPTVENQIQPRANPLAKVKEPKVLVNLTDNLKIDKYVIPKEVVEATVNYFDQELHSIRITPYENDTLEALRLSKIHNLEYLIDLWKSYL